MTYLHPLVGYCLRRYCRVHEFERLDRTDPDTLTMVASHPSRYKVECYTRLTQVVVSLHNRRICLSSEKWIEI